MHELNERPRKTLGYDTPPHDSKQNVLARLPLCDRLKARDKEPGITYLLHRPPETVTFTGLFADGVLETRDPSFMEF